MTIPDPEWKRRLERDLEPVLMLDDPRPKISAYHDMPFALFHYDPEAELALRKELSLLKIRLERRGKRVHIVSLAECLFEALRSQGLSGEALQEAEKKVGLRVTSETIFQILSERKPLVDLVVKRFPADGDPRRDIAFLTRAGSLFGVYRPYGLLETLGGRVAVPTVLFYPGTLVGPGGLSFMGVTSAEHNYRPKIF